MVLMFDGMDREGMKSMTDCIYCVSILLIG